MKEAASALNEHETKQQPEVEALRQRMEKAEQQIANIMEAIKAGIITTSTKTALEKAEAERAELEAALTTDAAVSSKVAGFLPDAAGRYKGIIANLRDSLSQDITQAQQHLKMLVGTVQLLPHEGELVAEVRHSLEGLLSLVLGKEFKARIGCGGRIWLKL